jgi:hypothetical protein
METISHFNTCEHNPEKWNIFVTSLRYYYVRYNIDPGLRILINMGLTSQDIHKTITKHPNIEWSDYHRLIHSQSKIGWEQLKYGRFTNEWNKHQENYEHEFPNPIP